MCKCACVIVQEYISSNEKHYMSNCPIFISDFPPPQTASKYHNINSQNCKISNKKYKYMSLRTHFHDVLSKQFVNEMKSETSEKKQICKAVRGT